MMSEDRPAALLAYLRRAGAPVTPTEAADALGVTRRSIRGYVARINAEVAPRQAITSTPAGYRLDEAVLRELPARPTPPTSSANTPQGRLHRIVRLLNDSPEGRDVFQLAEEFRVSEATVEADLGKVRRRMPGFGLRLLRDGDTVRLTGPEAGRRQLVSALLRDEASSSFLAVDAMRHEFPHFDLVRFKAELAAGLDEAGYIVNEFALNDVVLHIAIAVDRIAKDHELPEELLPEGASVPQRVADLLHDLVVKHSGIDFTRPELDPLVTQLTTRALAPRGELAGRLARDSVPAEDLAAMRAIIDRLDDEYQVDLNDTGFLLRLTVHVRNLLGRAARGTYNRNPLTESIKTSYPLIHDLAVFIAREIQTHWRVAVPEDEIAFIAMHVGAHLEAQTGRPERLRAVLVCPEYYELAATLRERIIAECGQYLEITELITRLEDVRGSTRPGAGADPELVISTIPLDGLPEAVVIRPFPGDRDFEAIRTAVARITRERERASERPSLIDYLEPTLFFRDLCAENETAMIRLLGDHLVDHGVIEAQQVESILERERLSSTAFSDGIAVPHAMTMNAQRSAIALVVNSTPMDWGGKRVSIIALIAFSPSDRSTFRPAFEEFTELLGSHATIARLVRNGTDYRAFLREMRAVLDR
jgi:lichenan operon transcriptional antiterminator